MKSPQEDSSVIDRCLELGNFLDGGISLLGQSLVVPYTLTAPLS